MEEEIIETNDGARRPLILVTNDDGIFAKGIKELVKAVKDLGEVVVVAPDKPQSGKSHSVTFDVPLWYVNNKFDDADRAYKCTGTPVDCVKIALFRILGRRPDIILSGINHGSNSSINIHYSGTMGAAIEGAIHKIPSIGFSLIDFQQDADFSTAGMYARQITEKVMNMENNERVCLNVNIPYSEPSSIKGIKITRQCPGQWKEDFVKNYHPQNKRPYYWLTGEYLNNAPDMEDTDEWALSNGYVSVQPVTIDTTDYEMMDQLSTL